MRNADMPKFRQYPNACGLTSLLMALKPGPRDLEVTLEAAWNVLERRAKRGSHRAVEFDWQRVLEWLLFQLPVDPALRTLVTDAFGETSEAMLAVLTHGILEAHPSAAAHSTFAYASDLPPSASSAKNLGLAPAAPWFPARKWLMRRVSTWKKDVELEMLALLFGCRFTPWPETRDGTGAVFFTRRELRDLVRPTRARGNRQGDAGQGQSPGASRKDAGKANGNVSGNVPVTAAGTAARKLAFLRAVVHAGNPVLLCVGYHWLAVKDLVQAGRVARVFYHDPASAREGARSVGRLRDVDRFYCFTFNPALRDRHAQVLFDLLARA